MALSKDLYVRRSYANAFGDDGEDWIPQRGFQNNRPRIVKLYDYYRDTYNKRPDLLLWAGLGRMAGGTVVSGLDTLTLLPFSDGSPIAVGMVEIGRAIFDDLAWLHEAILDDPAAALALAALQDTTSPAKRSYAEAVAKILTGIPDQVADGNHILLEIEQATIIQKVYDRFLPPSPEFLIFGKTRIVTREVHPYHKDFLMSFPTTVNKDVVFFNDRWEWINLPGGMWEKWANGFQGAGVGVTPEERSRLVNLSFDDILRMNFAPVVEALRPPGAVI